ncbi:hypothetical protein BDW72DRAFT_210453 [Aspergillus terricola var. indicus]
MPAISLPDPALVLLYLCITNSDMTKKTKQSLIPRPQIDFEAVGAAVGLKANSARMRWLRLKNKIESGFPDGKVTMSAGAGEANADPGLNEDQGQQDGEAASDAGPATPSPSKKRKLGAAKDKETYKKATPKSTPKGKGKGKGKVAQAQHDVVEVGAEESFVHVKSEEMDDRY